MKVIHDSETPAHGQQVITACAFIHHTFDGVEKVFLPKRAETKKFMPGIYELPGGHIEFGEDILAGLKREISEELGMQITVGDPFAAFTYMNEVKGSHSVEVVYFARFVGSIDTIEIHPEDHSGYRWISEDEIPEKIMNLDVFLRIVTILLFGGRFLYWLITERKADVARPKVKQASLREKIKRHASTLLGIFVVLQLVGILDVFPFAVTDQMKLFGFLLVLLSGVIAISARREIGLNWAHAAEYQIKKDHELVTSGIYYGIRHPIYLAFFLSYLGAELLVGSSLFFFFFITLPIVGTIQAKNEERILLQHFGEKYRKYMEHSKMFFPYIW
jgi:8-oxo-dGTP diphosphatase